MIAKLLLEYYISKLSSYIYLCILATGCIQENHEKDSRMQILVSKSNAETVTIKNVDDITINVQRK